MKIISYNMRFGGSTADLWSKVLAAFDPDFVLAQESLDPSGHLPAGAVAVWSRAEGQEWGSAIYSRTGTPRRLVVPDFGGWVTGVEVAVPDSPPLRVFSLHAPRRGSYHRAVQNILDRLTAFADGADLVLGGDFNMWIGERPEADGPTPREDLGIQARLRVEFKLLNCWTAANPGVPPPRTLRWSRDPETPYHHDGIFVPTSWATRLRACVVESGGEWEKWSDHNPVVATFE